jgi:cell wall assembly regulator SMI1
MPHRLTHEDLASLERAMRDAGAQVADEFRPGASHDTLDAAAEEFGFPLSHELRVWWEWHDGVVGGAEAGVGAPLYPQGPQMLPLEEALKSHRSWRERVRRAADPSLPRRGITPTTCSTRHGSPSCLRIPV